MQSKVAMPQKQEAAHWQPHVTKPLTKTYPHFTLGESSVMSNHLNRQTVHEELKKIIIKKTL
jgi:hypothetical protein